MKNRILMGVLPVLTCFALLPEARGQISPPPDGCSPNFTTAQGCNALNPHHRFWKYQALVGLRSLATPPAISILLSAVER